MTLSEPWLEAVDAWALAMRAAGRPETTIATRTDHLRRLGRHGGISDPWAVTLGDLEAWTGRQTWARETRRSVRASLRSFYGWGVTSGHIDESPALGLARVQPSRPSPRPTPDEGYRLALATATPRERLMVRLAAELGMRRAEVAQVHSSDLVEDLLGWSIVVHGKGDKERLVPLTPVLVRELRALPPGYAFPGNDHGHLSPRWVGKLVGRLLPDGFTMHSLRHRAASNWYAIDRDLLAIQDLLGHSSPVTTRSYVRLPDNAGRRLVLAAAD